MSKPPFRKEKSNNRAKFTFNGNQLIINILKTLAMSLMVNCF